VHLAISAHI